MKLEELYIPARLAKLFSMIENNEDTENHSISGRMLRVPESCLVELFLRLGAVPAEKVQKMSKNESGNTLNIIDDTIHSENQEFDTVLPEVLVEEWQSGPENLIRCIMNFKDMSLKTVAGRYGGKSAAANVANFLAKSDEELAAMRPATIKRLAEALECPEAWLLVLRDLKSG